ncbi:MAG TPA: MBL fold metallo-hydrolase [Candidatus Saccharimonadales bacterium]|nr:MBL fold metallo-hydrolase [Candidatus Saccharimonadales bacterium]
MELSFYGANCVVLSGKEWRVVVDDNLASLGGKSIVREGDIALFTNTAPEGLPNTKLTIAQPGEYEGANVSITGIPARAHMDEAGIKAATMYKVVAGDTTFLFTGHVYPELSEDQQERIGLVDVMVVPVGGNGYTLDGEGALKLIKDIEPKVVVPTHYDDSKLKFEMPQQSLEQALQALGMEVKEKVPKLKLKGLELTDNTQLIVVERS